MSVTRKRVLVVDDEPSIRDSLNLLLKGNFDVTLAENGQQALQLVEEVKPDLILLDVIMPKLDGVQTLRELRLRQIHVPVVMLTATTTVRTAVEAMKCGAVDYLNKPFDIEQLTALIFETFETQGERDLTPVKVELEPRRELPLADFGPLVGRSLPMTELFTKIKQVAERETTVLVTGESGTGKELIARQIHDLSARKTGPFVAINCAAIPESLIESELFGHEKGAFTHAVERRIGHFELADGGTLFLDEIGELSLTVQVKMLRFLQEQEFYRVGRSKPIRVDVRIVTATNKDLEELIREKRFREDLFYRINVVGIQSPPLRDRYEDIPFFLEHFNNKFAKRYGNRRLTFTPEAIETLLAYGWPGNVRELENVVESLMALSLSDTVVADCLPPRVRERSERSHLRAPTFTGDLKFEEAERIFETDMIIKALKRTGYVQTKAAEILGISRRILKYKMDKLHISEVPSAGISQSNSLSNNPEAEDSTEGDGSVVPVEAQ